MSVDNFNKYCESLLAKYKRRNAKAVARHLESLCRFLREEGNHVVQTMFGGSIQKRTYVTGLSDVDALLIVNQSSLVNLPPAKVKEYVRKTIKRRLPNNSVRAGELAVTVKYSDRIEIQLLPAIRTKTGGVRIAQQGTSSWSKIAHPERFAEKLAEVNAEMDGRVVPTIKLAKVIADCFIKQKDVKLSGYHIESLAIDAFNGYKGPSDSKAMLIHLLGHSVNAVNGPIADSTGQSRYVDEYLGPRGSRLRKGASTRFGQMRAEIKHCKTKAEFDNLFCQAS